jgi:hypothetical protein
MPNVRHKSRLITNHKRLVAIHKKENLMALKKAVISSIVLALFVTGMSSQALALEVGQKAPDFELNSTKGGKLKLSDLRGKNVLINFYRNDFDPT